MPRIVILNLGVNIFVEWIRHSEVVAFCDHLFNHSI